MPLSYEFFSLYSLQKHKNLLKSWSSLVKQERRKLFHGEGYEEKCRPQWLPDNKKL